MTKNGGTIADVLRVLAQHTKALDHHGAILRELRMRVRNIIKKLHAEQIERERND